MDSDNSCLVNPRNFVYIVPSTKGELSNGIVNPIIREMQRKSTELLGHDNTFEVSIGDQKLDLDLIDFPENATIYLDGDRIANYLSEGKLQITKHPNQVIVFNFDSTKTIRLGEIVYRYSRDTSEYTKTDTPITKGDKNNALNELAKHLIWNLASATTVHTGMSTGIYLMPKAGSTIDTGLSTNSGWIVSAGEVDVNGGEWHSVYSELPDVKTTNLLIGKTVDGITPNANQTFTFKLEHLNQDNTWVDKGSKNNTNGAVTFDGIGGMHVGWNLYRITESVSENEAGKYTMDDRTVYAVVEYKQHHSASGDVTAHVAHAPKYFMTTTGSDYTYQLTDSAFDESATTLEGAFGTEPSETKLKAVTKAVFENKQKKEGLSFTKIVSGNGPEDDTFTFLVQLNNITGVTDDTSIVDYVLSKSGVPGSKTIRFTKQNDGSFTAEVTLKKDQTANISGIPVSTSYSVTEIKVNETEFGSSTTAAGYTSTQRTFIGTIQEGAGTNEIIFTNAYNESILGSVKVTKAFVGIGSTQIPSNFRIKYKVGDESTEHELTDSGRSGAGTIDSPYEWTISDLDVGTVVTFIETGIEVNGYTVEAKANGEVISGQTKSAEAISNVEPGVVDFVNTYTTVVKGSLKIEKTVKMNGMPFSDADKAEIDDTFTFVIKKNNAPINEGKVGETSIHNGTVTITLKAKDAASVTVTDLSLGDYTITEDNANSSGYKLISPTNDDGHVTVTVTADNTANIPVATFTNSKLKTKAHLEVTKHVTGDTSKMTTEEKNKSYHFTFEQDSSNEKKSEVLPSSLNASTTGDATTSAGVTAVFGDITYTEEGTYYYKIKETVADTDKIAGMTYDNAEKWAKVEVNETNGVLTASVSYNNSKDGTYTNSLSFTNKYGKTDYAPEITKRVVGKNVPAGTYSFTITKGTEDGRPNSDKLFGIEYGYCDD